MGALPFETASFNITEFAKNYSKLMDPSNPAEVEINTKDETGKVIKTKVKNIAAISKDIKLKGSGIDPKALDKTIEDKIFAKMKGSNKHGIIQHINSGSYISRHAKTKAWKELTHFTITPGNYLIFITAQRIIEPEYKDPDGGQVGYWVDGIDFTKMGGIGYSEGIATTSGKSPSAVRKYTNIVQLAENQKNNRTITGNQILSAFTATKTSTLYLKARTSDPDAGGIGMTTQFYLFKVGG